MKQLKLISVCGLIVAIAAMAAWTPQARAAATAFDTACNEPMVTSSNGGTGFQPWAASIPVAGGTFLSTTSKLTAGTGCTNAWGMFTGTNATTSTSAQRLFTSANGTSSLQPGQQLTVDMANGGVNGGGSEGLSLWNGSSNSVWQLFFSGGSSTWTILDSRGNVASSLGYNPSNGVRAVFTLTGAASYIANLTNFAGGSSSVTNTLANPTGGQAINLLRFFTFNIGSGNNITINNISVSCPDTLAFTTQPTFETVPTNATALFTANTFGDSVTHQWQSSSNGGVSWAAIASGTNTYSISATSYESYLAVVATPGNNLLYRCIASDACGNTATSSVAPLTITNITATVITAQPANTAVCSNSPATFSVTVTGTMPGYNWLQQSNAGWGISNGWSVIASNAGSGVFLGSSTNNESGGPFCIGFGNNDINSLASGNAMGIFGPGIKVLRQFPNNLSAGQWFGIDMDNGNVDTGAQNGFSLHTSTVNGDHILMSFYFLGGQRNYKIFDGTGEHDTGIRFTRTGLRVQVIVEPTLGGTNTYVLGVLTNQCGSGASVTNIFSGLFETNGLPGALLLYNNDAAGGSANDLYFNNFIAGAAYDNADNYSVRNWANGGNGGDLPISGATGSSFTINNAQSNNVSYYAVVTNAAGATVSLSGKVTINPNTSLSLSESDVSCNGGTNGSVQATFSGGTGTLQVNIDGGAYSTQTSPHTFGGLSAGLHTVSVQDTKGCTSNLTISVNQPSAVTISSAVKQDNTVCGGTAGSITVTASGGTGSLQYSDNGGVSYQLSNQFTGLASGSYSVVAKDANGCISAATPVTINDPTGPSFTFAQVDETCNGQTIGSITVTASGGNGSYTYSKDNGATFQAGNLFTGLAAGAYTVVVKDGNGCTSGGQVITITQPSAVTFGTSQVNETCNGQSVGSITVTPSGGSGSGYTYSMDIGATFQAGNQFAGLSAGTYQIVVKDGNGCLSAATPITITEPVVLSCLVNPSIVTNCAGSAQIFAVNPTGGTAGYTYSWSGPNSFSASRSSVTNNNVQPADAGTYTVTVTDANGCQSICTATLTVNVAPSITVQPTTAAVCAGSTTNLTVTASGTPLNYVWRKLGTGWGSGGWSFANSGAASSEFIGSSTDNNSGDTSSNGGNDINTSGAAWALFNNGGVAEADRTLPGGLQIGQTFSIDMDNGNIQAGGTVGFGLQNTANSNNRLEVFFVGGSNDYTVSDNAGANDSGIGFTHTGIHCQITFTSADTYSITIIRYAGTVTAATNTLTGKLKGTVGTAIDRIRLFNANAGDCGFGCNADTLYFNNISFGCYDDNAGNYTNWTAGSDLGQGPLADGGDISGATTPTLTISPASAGDTGTYDVFVTNSCGGAISSNATLTVNSLPVQYGVGGGGSYCSGGSGVSVTLSNSDIGVNYQLELNNSPTSSPVAGTGSAISFVNQAAVGTYTVVANNATTGCSSTMTGSATVAVNPTPSCTVTPASPAICAGATQTFTVNPSGGTPGYTYLWSDGSTGPSITTNAAGTYTVTVTDTNGCTTTCSATLTVNPNPTIFNMTGGGAYCSGGSGVVVGLDGSQLGVNYQLQLNASPTGLPVAGTGGALPFGSQMAAGTYTVASDAISGCSAAMNGTAMVVVNSTPSTPTAGNNGPLLAGSTLNLTASTVPSTTYSWTGPNSFSSASQNPSIANVTSAASGIYSVTVTDGNGCTSAAGTTTVVVTPLRITAVAKESNNIRVTWLTTGGTTNALQATKGAPGYNTNFVDISGPILILGVGDTTTNYLDISGATNSPAEFYRVRLVP